MGEKKKGKGHHYKCEGKKTRKRSYVRQEGE